jgi:hypothetical protein
LIAAVFGFVMLTSSSAEAQNKKKAKEYWTKATAKYNIGDFQEAVDLYKKAYEEWPDAAFLFNIAQSYRQLDDCKNSLFFYNRYLLVKPNADNRVKVESTIKELEESCKNRESIKVAEPHGTADPDKPPPGDDDDDDTPPPTGDDDDDTPPPTGDDDDDNPAGDDDDDVAMADDDDDDFEDDDDDDGGGISGGVDTGNPTKLHSIVAVGPAFLGLGDLEVPAQFTFTVGAGYPLDLGAVGVDVGGMLTYTPVPWDNGAGTSGTASMTTLLLNTGATYPVAPKINIRGELGLGVLLFGGLAMDNVFTEGGRAADAALSIFNLRFGLSAEYEVTPNIYVNAAPVVYSFSPAKDGLREEIGSLTRFELMFGAGYRM